ncbi:preprotein translocase subunit SecF [Prosthecomicrobium hirschii]|uniref:Protein-export membrane protein SecF n=1 Tax=Prosthecodimorpha hirschii TaxID=665126 RepID=A0A0P6VV83_9HYPH|nr:protein translocase subunit SecF [Prosthecomicrobium hirschii]KPL54847.1 preprotein translocase subunit SecF [Prosthecomicrobium hirschii]
MLRLIPDDTKIPFMRWRSVTFTISVCLLVLTVLAWGAMGINYGIDFTGGNLIEVRHKGGPADLSELRKVIGGLELGEAQVQGFGQGDDVMIRLPEQPGGDAAQQVALNKVKDKLGDAYEIRRTEVVGPSVSADLRRDGAIAVVVSLGLVLIYLWFRFEWQFAIGAVLTTAHDIVLTMGVIIIFQLQFDLQSLAAVLTIVGYSLNDTVVVYDRIRESLRKYKKMPLPELIDLSINQTLSRTICTALTTFMAVLALFVFGGEALRGFNFTMLVGILIGTYSSIVVSAPMLIFLKLRTGGSPEGVAKSDAAAAAKARP